MAAGVLLGPSAPVAPGPLVDGPIRREISPPSPGGRAGGAAGPGLATRRALRLVGHDRAGQPTPATRDQIAEWGEGSPWASLAARQGVPGGAVPTS